MADYKFDGTYLIRSGRNIARVSGDFIEDCQNGNRNVARISGDFVQDYQNGSRNVARLSGDDIQDYQNGSRNIAKLDEIKRKIDGYPSRMQTVALWWFFIR